MRLVIGKEDLVETALILVPTINKLRQEGMDICTQRARAAGSVLAFLAWELRNLRQCRGRLGLQAHVAAFGIWRALAPGA